MAKKDRMAGEAVETNPDADSLAGPALRVAELEALFAEEGPEEPKTPEPLVEGHGPGLVCPACGAFRFHVPEFVLRLHEDGFAEENQTEFRCTSCHWQGGMEQLKPKGGSIL
mgnify:CR=1 FL=1